VDNNDLRTLFTVWWNCPGRAISFMIQQIARLMPTPPYTEQVVARTGGILTAAVGQC